MSYKAARPWLRKPLGRRAERRSMKQARYALRERVNPQAEREHEEGLLVAGLMDRYNRGLLRISAGELIEVLFED